MENRSAESRIADTLRRLESEADVWIATASAAGAPHLIPLSLAWDGTNILLATPPGSPTARNIDATGQARASLADTDDVVVIVASAVVTPFERTPDDVADSFAERAGWDPRKNDGRWALLTLAPETIHAWKGEPELVGRTIMRRGEWVS
ncbi:MAG: pyridoxamine 5'-phosphate oxidase [bacterium]|nr:pyridoxamine 5'-phosphate oxidase [bacterium]